VHGALAGIRILDLTMVAVGPYATQLLADMGAEVIKVEPPGGDTLRQTGMGHSPDMAAFFIQCNRNKRSIVIDLKQEAGRQVLFRLAENADVFVHNMRPQALAKLGMSYDSLRARNPRIVFCQIVGFGSGGRYSGQPAYDDVIQGASGMVALQGKVSPEPVYFAMVTADKTTGVFAAFAIGTALLHRTRTGQGQFIEVPMFESMVSFNFLEYLYGRTFEPALGEAGYPRHLIPLRKPFKTKDGYICFLPSQDRHWQTFFELAGRPEVMDDPRFATRAARFQHGRDLWAIAEPLLRTRTTAEWVTTLQAAEIPCMPVSELDDVVRDPHLEDVGFFRLFEHATEGQLRLMNVPFTMSETPGSIRHLPPRLGEHSEEILREFGYAEGEIYTLLADGTVKTMPS
jgi:crotonobetainyl-CoA:carnitine CoA-transferase CaiB-like acyl-CoA transferase